jgi:hypothetical protein
LLHCEGSERTQDFSQVFFGWLSKRREQKALVAKDAAELIAAYGDTAYHVARERVSDAKRNRVIDGNRDAGHWDRVRQHIAKLVDRNATDTATRYLGQ